LRCEPYIAPFPLTLVSGAGAAARNSIGLLLVGGMAIGTFFTLFVIPSIYMLVARDYADERACQSATTAAGGAQAGPVLKPATAKRGAATAMTSAEKSMVS